MSGSEGAIDQPERHLAGRPIGKWLRGYAEDQGPSDAIKFLIHHTTSGALFRISLDVSSGEVGRSARERSVQCTAQC